jgi:hypothetical protein
MKALCVLLLAVSFGTLATAQNPYPTGCNGVETETKYCSDVDPRPGSCHGSLPNVIVTP